MPSVTSQVQKNLSIFMPTWFGAVMYSALMALTIVIHQFAAIRQTLGIPSGIDLQGLIGNNLNDAANHLFGTTHTNTAVVALFWAVVGIFVYMLVLGITGALRELGSGLEERTYLWPKGVNPHTQVKGFVERAGVHALAFIILVLYIFLPLAIVLHGPIDFGNVLASNAVILNVVWFLVGLVVWHGLTVVLRLLLLRERLLG